MGKIITFLNYTKDFVKHGEFRYILSSIRYILTGKTTRKTRPYKSSLGRFMVRKGTLDFQFANYAYEKNVKRFVYKHLNDYDVFLDVGANIGTYSIISANNGLRAIAFEPVKSNYEAFITNLGLNNLQDTVVTYPLALGKTKTRANFTLDMVNTGASHLTEYSDITEEIENPEFEDINIVTFDEIFEELNIGRDEKVFMKVDVEGMEPDVLIGAADFIKNHPNILVVIETIHVGRERLEEVFNNLAEFEFLEVDGLNMGARKIK